MTLRIERAEMANLPDLMRIQTVAYTPELVESVEVLESRIRTGEGYSFVALSDNEVVGYVLAHPWKRNTSPGLENAFTDVPDGSNVIHIHDLAIEPAARSLGISKHLLRVLTEAASRRFDCLTLVAVQGAQAYWTHVGFEDEGPATGYDSGARFMSKRLR